MKRVLFLILLVSLILSIEMFSEDQDFDFRNANWGMTIKQVRASEGSRKAQLVKDNQVVYFDTISSKSFLVSYDFIDNKLVSAGYILADEHSNENLYIQDYDKLKELLIEKYGEPSDKWLNGTKYSEKVWLNDLFKDDPNDWGMAMSLGHLTYQLCWIIPRTEIMLKLTGDNYEIILGIVYYSTEFRELQEKEKEKETKDKL